MVFGYPTEKVLLGSRASLTLSSPASPSSLCISPRSPGYRPAPRCADERPVPLAPLHFNPYQDRILTPSDTGLRLLHFCRELERVTGQDAVIMVSGRNQRRRIADSTLYVVEQTCNPGAGRDHIGDQLFEISPIVAFVTERLH